MNNVISILKIKARVQKEMVYRGGRRFINSKAR